MKLTAISALLLIATSALGTDKPAVEGEAVNPLLVAIHLLRPEVIERCLSEIDKSKYEFVWTAVQAKDGPGAVVNTTLSLTAFLLEKAATTSGVKSAEPVGEAVLTITRDVERLQRGQLFFACKLKYQLKPAKK